MILMSGFEKNILTICINLTSSVASILARFDINQIARVIK